MDNYGVPSQKKTEMKPSWEVLRLSPLFKGISRDEAISLLQCLSASDRFLKKGETVFREGDPVDSMGVVLTGCVSIVRDNFWGNRSIISKVLPGKSFGEFYAASGKPISVTVEALMPTSILLLNIRRVTMTCPTACAGHLKLVRNLLSVMAERTLEINTKLLHVTQRTTRQKLLSYLSEASSSCGSVVFDIPYNRQELADYLGLDRSAMSAELSRMKKDRLVSFTRNHFELLSAAEK